MAAQNPQIITTDGVEVPTSTKADGTSGDAAAEVFTCLDEGMSPTDIVIKLALPVARVETLWQTWARHRNHALLSPEMVAAVHAALPLDVRAPLDSSGSGIVERAKALGRAEPRICLRCHGQPAQYCGSCAEKAARRAAIPTTKATKKATKARSANER